MHEIRNTFLHSHAVLFIWRSPVTVVTAFAFFDVLGRTCAQAWTRFLIGRHFRRDNVAIQMLGGAFIESALIGALPHVANLMCLIFVGATFPHTLAAALSARRHNLEILWRRRKGKSENVLNHAVRMWQQRERLHCSTYGNNTLEPSLFVLRLRPTIRMCASHTSHPKRSKRHQLASRQVSHRLRPHRLCCQLELR